MFIKTLKSKIAYATMTQKDLFYVGSITIDEEIMKAANIQENEKVHVVNLQNGERLETYVIKGAPAARKGEVGDHLFILSYAIIDPAHEKLEPVIVDLQER